MTVAELIAALQEMPQDWTVDIYGPSDDDGLGDIWPNFTMQWGGGEVNLCVEKDTAMPAIGHCPANDPHI